MKINMQNWANQIIAAGDVKNLPVLYFPVLKNMGMSVPESVNDPVKIARAMKEVIDEYPETIAAITGMDLTVDSEAFGAEIMYSDIQAPAVRTHVVKTAEDIRNLTLPDIHSGRVDIFSQACVEAAKIIQDRPIMGGMLGPFSLAANLMEVSEALMMTIQDPESMLLLIQKCTDWLIMRAKEYKNAGANGIFIAEPTAGLLNPKMLDKFSSFFVKQIVDAVQDEYFFLVLHDCGKVKKSVPSMVATGCKGHHYGNAVDMADILPQIPENILVFGNIDPSVDFFSGTPETIREKTRALLEKMEPYPHFVLSSGCDLAPTVKNEVIEAYYKALRDYNAEKGFETVI